jgi:hypothetical protein
MVELGEIAVVVERKPPSTRRKRKVEQRTRDRKAAEAARAEYERLQVIAREAAAEDQAPKAQRIEVVGFTAGSIRADRLAGRVNREDQRPIIIREPSAPPDPKRGGYRRTDSLAAMNRKSHGRTISHDHLKAKKRLQDDYQMGILGATAPRSGLSPTEGAIIQAEEFRWLSAAQRYRNAMNSIRPGLRGIVEALAIHEQTVPWVTQALGQAEKTVIGLIVAAFDELADHYWPDRDTRESLIQKALTQIRPYGFDFLVSSIGEIIPQERIGQKLTA